MTLQNPSDETQGEPRGLRIVGEVRHGEVEWEVDGSTVYGGDLFWTLERDDERLKVAALRADLTMVAVDEFVGVLPLLGHVSAFSLDCGVVFIEGGPGWERYHPQSHAHVVRRLAKILKGLPRLQRLKLRIPHSNDLGLTQALLRPSHAKAMAWKTLRHLSLEIEAYPEPILGELFKPRRLEKLETLSLKVAYVLRGGNAQPPEHLPQVGRALLGAGASWCFSELSLEGTLGAESLQALLAHPGVAGLKSLSLRHNHLSDASLEEALGAHRLEALETLDLSHNPLGVESLKRLLVAELPALKVLRLARSQVALSPDVLEALLTSRKLPALRSLRLSSRRHWGEPSEIAGVKVWL